jgi:hypothetical protein
MQRVPPVFTCGTAFDSKYEGPGSPHHGPSAYFRLVSGPAIREPLCLHGGIPASSSRLCNCWHIDRSR